MEISAARSVFDDAAATATNGITSASASTFGALVNVGAMVGAVAGGSLANAGGRRFAIVTCAVLWIVSWFATATASSVALILFARFVVGVSVGIASACVPVYIAEVSPSAIRGTLGALNQLGVVVGILLVYLLGYVRQTRQATNIACEPVDALLAADDDAASCARSIAPSGWTCEAAAAPAGGGGATAGGVCVGEMANWVELSVAAALVALCLLAGALGYLPETPSFLRGAGKAEEAARVEAWLTGARSGGGDAERHSDSMELRSVVGDEGSGAHDAATDGTSAAKGGGGDGSDDGGGRGGGGAGGGGNSGNSGNSGSSGGGLAGVFTARMRAPLSLACGLMLTQQLSGINAVIFYSSDILLRGGMADPNLGGLLIMSIQVAMTALCSYLVDKAGRRPLLLASLGGMVVACLCLASFFHNHNTPTWLALASLVLYTCSFSLGLGALPWLIMGEIFPTHARAAASSVATMLNWGCSFVVTLLFSGAAAALGPAAVFLGFACICMAGGAFIWLCLPETKGVPLEEVEALFRGAGMRSDDASAYA